MPDPAGAEATQTSATQPGRSAARAAVAPVMAKAWSGRRVASERDYLWTPSTTKPEITLTQGHRG